MDRDLIKLFGPHACVLGAALGPIKPEMAKLIARDALGGAAAMLGDAAKVSAIAKALMSPVAIAIGAGVTP